MRDFAAGLQRFAAATEMFAETFPAIFLVFITMPTLFA
jgi:hypothetical protein